MTQTLKAESAAELTKCKLFLYFCHLPIMFLPMKIFGESYFVSMSIGATLAKQHQINQNILNTMAFLVPSSKRNTFSLYCLIGYHFVQ